MWAGTIIESFRSISTDNTLSCKTVSEAYILKVMYTETSLGSWNGSGLPMWPGFDSGAVPYVG